MQQRSYNKVVINKYVLQRLVSAHGNCHLVKNIKVHVYNISVGNWNVHDHDHLSTKFYQLEMYVSWIN